MAQSQPNIIFIMGDDIGWFNIGAYHQGIMAGRTPNLDRLAAEGMRFTDYYAEASCTAGRANFITGELPIRTGLTTVGQAGAKIGMPAAAPTIATALKSMGYATGQFGKNHLGDRNEFLPTVHGFDEFFGYLYHLDAMEDPDHPQLSARAQGQGRPAQHDPLAGRPTTTTRPTSRAGARSASRRSRTPARFIPKRMETVDDEILDRHGQVHRQGQAGQQAVLRLAQSDAHARRHASLGEIREDAQRAERLVRSKKPAWPSSTTSSARS